jgi:hypothetical protein
VSARLNFRNTEPLLSSGSRFVGCEAPSGRSAKNVNPFMKAIDFNLDQGKQGQEKNWNGAYTEQASKFNRR